MAPVYSLSVHEVLTEPWRSPEEVPPRWHQVARAWQAASRLVLRTLHKKTPLTIERAVLAVRFSWFFFFFYES